MWQEDTLSNHISLLSEAKNSKTQQICTQAEPNILLCILVYGKSMFASNCRTDIVIFMETFLQRFSQTVHSLFYFFPSGSFELYFTFHIEHKHFYWHQIWFPSSEFCFPLSTQCIILRLILKSNHFQNNGPSSSIAFHPRISWGSQFYFSIAYWSCWTSRNLQSCPNKITQRRHFFTSKHISYKSLQMIYL